MTGYEASLLKTLLIFGAIAGSVILAVVLVWKAASGKKSPEPARADQSSESPNGFSPPSNLKSVTRIAFIGCIAMTLYELWPFYESLNILLYKDSAYLDSVIYTFLAIVRDAGLSVFLWSFLRSQK